MGKGNECISMRIDGDVYGRLRCGKASMLGGKDIL